jgi:drug/metabolite transporter (DMT)-like permease
MGLACRGLFGATSLLCFFYSIDHIGLSKATLYCYMYPIYAAVFAWWDLGEKPTPAAILALLLAVIGAILTLDSHGITLNLTRGDIAGIVAGVMSGAAVTSIRRLTRTERSAWIVLSFTLCSTLLAIPFIKQGHVSATLPVIGSLLAVGVSAIAAQVLLTKGLRYVNAVEGGVLSLTTVPLSAGLAVLVLQETVHARFVLGAALILVAATTLIVLPGRSSVPLPTDV